MTHCCSVFNDTQGDKLNQYTIGADYWLNDSVVSYAEYTDQSFDEEVAGSDDNAFTIGTGGISKQLYRRNVHCFGGSLRFTSFLFFQCRDGLLEYCSNHRFRLLFPPLFKGRVRVGFVSLSFYNE